MKHSENETTLHQGRHLHLVRCGGYEYVKRAKASGIVAILAVTDEDRVILIEQYRPPVQKYVIELPAGLAGDLDGLEREELAAAARRELREETGYEADRLELLLSGPVAQAISASSVTIFRALGSRKVAEGGGDASEEIRVHEVPAGEVYDWLDRRRAQGVLVDLKLYSALHYLGGRPR